MTFHYHFGNGKLRFPKVFITVVFGIAEISFISSVLPDLKIVVKMKICFL